MKNLVKFATAAFGALIIAGSAATPAAAKIHCKGNAQLIYGQGEIITPYCEDEYLAKVAREYGAYYSGRQIRQNPSKKVEACELVGHDNRVADNCATVLDYGFDRKHR